MWKIFFLLSKKSHSIQYFFQKGRFWKGVASRVPKVRLLVGESAISVGFFIMKKGFLGFFALSFKIFFYSNHKSKAENDEKVHAALSNFSYQAKETDLGNSYKILIKPSLNLIYLYLLCSFGYYYFTFWLENVFVCVYVNSWR